MKIYEAYCDVPESARNSVIVIGNFDGVHRGHCAILSRARAKADALNVPLAVLTFEPHPRAIFMPDEPPRRITPVSLKQERLAAKGVDILFSLPFNWDFASQSAEQFVQDILIDGLEAAHIFVGYNFKFGQLRKGTPQTIRDAGLGITVIDEILGEADAVISSSAVRQSLRHGDIVQANNILGWHWEMRGTVVRGDQRGREMGYPTANMALGDTIHPAYGIYACFAHIEGEQAWHMAAANIGIRPMFEVDVAQVETFIFDFDCEIYGKTLCVRPVQRLRGEAKFDTLDLLLQQMEKDCVQARTILEKIDINEE